MKINLLTTFSLLTILLENITFAYWVDEKDFEPKYSGAESYNYEFTIKFNSWELTSFSSGSFELYLNGNSDVEGTSGGSVYFDKKKELYTWYLYFNIPGKEHKIGQNEYWILLNGRTFCSGYGPYIYGYITPTISISATPTICSTPTMTVTPSPLPMIEKWIPYWAVNEAKGIDTFFTITNTGNNFVKGAFEFYDSKGNLMGKEPLNLSPHGQQNISVYSTMFTIFPTLDSDLLINYYGSAKIMVLGSEFKVYAYVYKTDESIEYTYTTSELLSSPVYIPHWTFSKGKRDTILYVTNPNAKQILLNCTMFRTNGDFFGSFKIPVNSHEMKERALSIHVVPSVRFEHGSCLIKWESGEKILIFTLVKNLNSDKFYPIPVK